MHELSMTNIAPSKNPLAAAAAKTLLWAGLWDELCCTCLWQPETNSGEPVHDEAGALAIMLDYLVEPFHGAHELRQAFVSSLGTAMVNSLLDNFGRSAIPMASWKGWGYLLGRPLHQSEDDDPQLFADG